MQWHNWGGKTDRKGALAIWVPAFLVLMRVHTHTHRVRSKFLGDDLSLCKNTPSCLLWWMSNTWALRSFLYIEAVASASCSTTQADQIIDAAKVTVIQSPMIARSSISTRLDTGAHVCTATKGLLLLFTAAHSESSWTGKKQVKDGGE